MGSLGSWITSLGSVSWGQYYETNFYLKNPNFYVKFQKALKDFENYLGKCLLLHNMFIVLAPGLAIEADNSQSQVTGSNPEKIEIILPCTR